MIDHPQPDEIEKLVALAQATGFFNPEEVAVVGEMLADYMATAPDAGPGAPESDEYLWAVYREAPGTPPLGFVCYGPSSFSEGTYEVYWIAVDPEHQSRKIGTALLQSVEEDLKKRRARHLYLETSDRAQYAPTRRFYERRGYEPVAHLADFYHIGDGKVIYRKVLQPI
jgi:D-alanine-D-alanine ligase